MAIDMLLILRKIIIIKSFAKIKINALILYKLSFLIFNIILNKKNIIIKT